MHSNNAISNIIVKIQGGLGNQLFQYALGRSLQLIYNKSVTYDISGYGTDASQIQRSYMLNQFNTVVNFADLEQVNYLQKYQRKLGPIGYLKTLLTANSKRYFQDYGLKFNPEVFHLQPPVYISGYWQSERYFFSIADQIRRELTLKNAPNEKNASALSKIQSTPSISLHIRRGDYVTNKTANSFYGTISLSYYQEAVKKLIIAEPQATIYAFSDDPQWVKDNLKVDAPIVFVDWNSGDQAYEDLRLMAACHHNITANSTFSWWGAWLNKNPSKIVIAPKNWFADTSIKNDLLPLSWQRL